MESPNNTPTDIDYSDFITSDFLREAKGEQPVSSTMFDKIFLNHSRVPKELVEKFASKPEEVEKLLSGSVPLFQTFLEKPYWRTQDRPYDRINVDIFGAVCLAADRHVLDVIIGHGSLITNASRYTLRQACELLGLKDVAWGLIQQDIIDRPLSNRGIYFHISFNELCKAIGVAVVKKNRNQILERLRRLSLMMLTLTPSKEGNELPGNAVNISLLDKEIITILDKDKPRNGMYDDETRTDLLVNISQYYAQTLEKDGNIDRKRLINTYVHLVGKNSIEDFYKSIDSNKRKFIHGQSLHKLLNSYFENKMGTFGLNQRHKVAQLFDQIVNERDKLLEHFNLALRPAKREGGKPDYTLFYINDND